MKPHYNLIKTGSGFHSTLCAGNNRVICSDPREWDKEEYAKIIIGHLQKMDDMYIDRKKNSLDLDYFCFCHKASGDVAYLSKTYNTKQAMERGIKSVLKNAGTQDIRFVDRTGKK